VAAELNELGLKTYGVALDVTRPDSVDSVVEQIVTQTGRLDILVHRAAMDPKFAPEPAQNRSNAFETYPLDPGKRR
jgi:NAD(P)-dependent dehydrogenase (short-subunit alcohol dehydrogenase family)